ncbi:MAG: hypothetical protein JXP48_11075, partial [Acidobacteria bacterium]|nr:hypothetical protein [Acidobacteriota bacterium]
PDCDTPHPVEGNRGILTIAHILDIHYFQTRPFLDIHQSNHGHPPILQIGGCPLLEQWVDVHDCSPLGQKVDVQDLIVELSGTDQNKSFWM